MTVLLVDDDPTFRNLLHDLLLNEGHEVLAVENGEEAMRRLAVVRPDIIVTDIYMPVMDGAQLHKNVRDNPLYATLPFLFISGYDDGSTHTSHWDPRYDGFHCKNKPLEEMKNWIEYLTTSLEKRDKYPPGN